MWEIRLTLAENARSHINESLRCVQRAEADSDATQWVFAVVHLTQGVELLLKERLRREHRSLVFNDIDRASDATVGLENAIRRLERWCDVALTKQDLTRLKSIKRTRNAVVHYDVDATEGQLKNAYLDMFEFVHKFHVKELEEELHLYVDESLWELEAELLEQFAEQLVNYQGAVVPKEYPATIVNAQRYPYFEINDRFIRRLPFGEESWRPDNESDQTNCGGCLVLPGQLHVPRCAYEQCPSCDSKASICDCYPIESREPSYGLFGKKYHKRGAWQPAGTPPSIT